MIHRVIRRMGIGALAALVSTALVPAAVRAQPGDIDPSFGPGGRVTIAEESSMGAAGFADGRIAVLVHRSDPTGATPGTEGIDVFTVDGSLDATWGTGGRATLSTGNGGAWATVAVDGAGRVLVGSGRASGQVARLSANGSLDPAFGTGGIAPVGSSGPVVVAPRSDGSVAYVVSHVASISGGVSDDGSNAQVGLLTSAGQPATAFGQSGSTDTGVRYSPVALAVSADDSILIAGARGECSMTNPTIQLTSFASHIGPSGALDQSFGTGGTAPLPQLGSYSVSAILGQPDGRVVVRGGGVVARLQANGSSDPSFRGGSVQPFGHPAGTCFNQETLSAGPHGDVLVAESRGSPGLLSIAALGADGFPDAAYGLCGTARMDGGAIEGTLGMVVGPGGRVTAVLSDYVQTRNRLVLERLEGDGALPGAANELVSGAWMTASDGGVFGLGSAGFCGGMGGRALQEPVVGMARMPTANGYWLVARDGGIFSFGHAGFHGSTGGMRLNAPVVGMAATPTSLGYWLVASDGGIFAFGDAGFYGSTGSLHLNQPIVGMAPTPSGHGYWLVASDGGVFAFGDARFYGSTGGIRLNAPVVGMAATPTGSGYRLVARDGGVFTYGDARYAGSMGGVRLNAPIIAIVSMPDLDGYWLAAADGGKFDFGTSQTTGSLGGLRLNAPIVGAARP